MQSLIKNAQRIPSDDSPHYLTWACHFQGEIEVGTAASVSNSLFLHRHKYKKWDVILKL